MPRKLPEMKVTFSYFEPKTPKEKADCIRRMNACYDILFKEVIARRKEEMKAKNLIETNPLFL